MIPIMTFGKGQDYGDTKRSGVASGKVVGRNKSEEQRGFLGNENILHDIIMMNTCHYTFVQNSIECSTLSVNPNVNYGF